MNKIELIELNLINFRSWKELHLTNIHKLGMTLVFGKNGSGKSTIRQAVEYLLTDKTSDSIPLEELTYNSNGNCEISCVLKRDKDTITITKYREHLEYANSTILDINGNKDLTHNDRRETQKEIENLLGIDERVILTSTIFSAESLSFPKAKEAERKKLIYDVLNLNKYKEACEKARDKADEINKDNIDCNVVLENKKSIHNTYKNDLKETEYELSIYEQSKEIKIQGTKSEINNLKFKDKEDTKQEIFKLKNQYKEIDTDKLDKLSVLKSTIEDEITQLNQDKKIIENNLFSIKDATCPILDEKCNTLQTKKNIIHEKYSPQYTEIIKQIKDKNLYLDKITDRITKIDDNINYNNSINNQIQELQTELNQTKEYNKTILDKRETLEKYIEEIQNEKNPYTQRIETSKLRLKELEKEIKELKQRIDNNNEEIKYYEYWKKGFSTQGIPNLKSESFLEALELETNKVLGNISDQMRVEIVGQDKLKSGEVREKIRYEVLHPDKKIKSYYSYSAGQRQRIRIADMFAMYSLLSKFNFIIMDEVLEMSLDSKGKSSVLDQLRTQSSNLDCLLVVSHDKEVQDKFDNIIHIKETNGVSDVLYNK